MIASHFEKFNQRLFRFTVNKFLEAFFVNFLKSVIICFEYVCHEPQLRMFDK